VGLINGSDDPLKKYPTTIKESTSDNVTSTIHEFIDIRTSALEESLKKLEELLEELSKEGYVSNSENYDYGYILYSETTKNLSTDSIVDNFVKKHPNGVYVTDKDMELLDARIDKIKEKIEIKEEFLKRKYKDGIKTKNNTYTGRELIKYYLYARVTKDFLTHNLTQQDMNEIMESFKYKLLYDTDPGFETKPEFWNNMKNKTKPDGTLQNYYFMIFSFSQNIAYHRLKKNSLVRDILKQSIGSWRHGYIFVDIEELGINDYMDEQKLFSLIDSLITNSFIYLENKALTRDNFVPFNQSVKYVSNEKITKNLETMNRYSPIKLTRKAEYNKYKDVLHTYYLVSYVDYKLDKSRTISKQFETQKEAKDFIVNELSGEDPLKQKKKKTIDGLFKDLYPE